MRAAQRISEPMTWSEICEQFPDQWIALVALDWADDNDRPFLTALVAGHGSRHEALQQAKPLRKLFSQLGPFFTGAPGSPDGPTLAEGSGRTWVASGAEPATHQALDVPELPPIVYVA
ncbi:MAG TPA: hypothetical protein VH165_04335 [Kofleriaceae bacterium]|jgi:hypothetical protein|nr:hypothetical protein [Kofleriaceae bacterium]